MHSMQSMVRGQGICENYVLIGGENEIFFELDLSSGQVYQKSQVGDLIFWLDLIWYESSTGRKHEGMTRIVGLVLLSHCILDLLNYFNNGNKLTLLFIV